MVRGFNLRNKENARSISISKRQNSLIKEMTKTTAEASSLKQVVQIEQRTARARKARNISAMQHNATLNSSLKISKPRMGGYK